MNRLSCFRVRRSFLTTGGGEVFSFSGTSLQSENIPKSVAGLFHDQRHAAMYAAWKNAEDGRKDQQQARATGLKNDLKL